MGLHKRLLQRGQEGPGPSDRYLQAFLNLDVDRLSVMRAIGAGSEAARLVAMDRLMTMFGSLPDFGKANALWDMTAETVGYRNAARYCVPPGENETPTVDASIAQLENATLLAGGQIEVLDGQNNFVHAKKHLEAEMPLVQQAQQAPDMLVQILPGLNALNVHTTQHVQKLSQDPQMKQESAQFRKMIQQSDEIIHNGLMKAQKIQREMAAQAQKGAPAGPNGAPVNGAPVGPDGQPAPQATANGLDPKMEMKIRGDLAYRQAKMEALNQETQLKLSLNQQRAQQELAIADAKAAQEIQQRR